jgi:hypothetical protein
MQQRNGVSGPSPSVKPVTSRGRDLWVAHDSESETYVTTDGQSASLSWNKAPIWGLRPNFYYCKTVAGLLMWGACRLQSLLALARAVILWSEPLWTRDHIATDSRSNRFPGNTVPLLRNVGVEQIYPWKRIRSTVGTQATVS